MDMDKFIGHVCEIFCLLHTEQARDWEPRRRPYRERKSKISKTALSVQARLTREGWQPVSREELERWLRADGSGVEVDFESKGKVMYLPSLEKNADFVPVLSLKVTIDDEHDEIRLRVMLVTQDGDKNCLYGIGFRLDTPESGNVDGESKGNEDEGRHDFYHAQFIRRRGFNWGPRIETIGWLPEHQPSFPLVADDPITLVLSLLLALYGKRYCGQFIQRHGGSLSALGSARKKLQPWIGWKDSD